MTIEDLLNFHELKYDELNDKDKSEIIDLIDRIKDFNYYDIEFIKNFNKISTILAIQDTYLVVDKLDKIRSLNLDAVKHTDNKTFNAHFYSHAGVISRIQYQLSDDISYLLNAYEEHDKSHMISMSILPDFSLDQKLLSLNVSNKIVKYSSDKDLKIKFANIIRFGYPDVLNLLDDKEQIGQGYMNVGIALKVLALNEDDLVKKKELSKLAYDSFIKSKDLIFDKIFINGFISESAKIVSSTFNNKSKKLDWLLIAYDYSKKGYSNSIGTKHVEKYGTVQLSYSANIAYEIAKNVSHSEKIKWYNVAIDDYLKFLELDDFEGKNQYYAYSNLIDISSRVFNMNSDIKYLFDSYSYGVQALNISKKLDDEKLTELSIKRVANISKELYSITHDLKWKNIAETNFSYLINNSKKLNKDKIQNALTNLDYDAL